MSVLDIANRYDAFTLELRRVVEEHYGPLGLTFASWVSLYSHDIISGIEQISPWVSVHIVAVAPDQFRHDVER